MGTVHNTDDILVLEDGAVMNVMFNRPQARNAFTLAMYEQLADIIKAIPGRQHIRVVVFSGAGGKAFASGTDIAEFIDFTQPAQSLAYEHRLEEILRLIEAIPVPTIASVAGACTGGGLMIAAACDLRIATADAAFGIPVARTLGNCLSASNLARLERLMGAGRVMTMLLTARLMSGSEAWTAGFLSEVVPDLESLPGKTVTMARQMANNAPITMRVTKEALRLLGQDAADAAAEDRLILEAYQSEDFAEGVRAFLGKRKPVWRGQ